MAGTASALPLQEPEAAPLGPHQSPPRTRLFLNRNFLRLFAAGIASVSGASIAQVCLIWIIVADTGSALHRRARTPSRPSAGIAFSLVGGTLADRYDRRRLMVLADFSRAVTVAVLFVSLDVFGFRLGATLIASFVAAAFSTVFNPSEQAITPVPCRSRESGQRQRVHPIHAER